MAYQLDKTGSVVNTAINEEYDNNPKVNTVWDDLRFPANSVGFGATAPSPTRTAVTIPRGVSREMHTETPTTEISSALLVASL